MAEINIERHERSIWPWIVGLLVLALLAWWLLSMRSSGNDDNLVAETSPGAVADTLPGTGADTRAMMPAAVSDFIRYAEEPRTRPAADSTHSYEAEGVRRLAAALDELADRDTIGKVSLDVRIAALRERADALQRDWRSTAHAGHTRVAFDSAAALIESMQQQRFPSLAGEVAAVRQAADGVKPDGLLLEQTDEVRRFFDRAADAIRAMASAPARTT